MTTTEASTAAAVAWLEDPERLARQRKQIRSDLDALTVRKLFEVRTDGHNDEPGYCWCHYSPDIGGGATSARYAPECPPPRFGPRR